MPQQPGGMQPPLGHRPSNANNKAPLPNLGKLSRSIIGAFTQGTVQQQAGVLPGTPRVPQPPVQQRVTQPAPAFTPLPAFDPRTVPVARKALDRILPAYDAELVRPVARRMRALGMEVLTQAKAAGLSDDGSALAVDQDGLETHLSSSKVRSGSAGAK